MHISIDRCQEGKSHNVNVLAVDRPEQMLPKLLFHIKVKWGRCDSELPAVREYLALPVAFIDV